MNGHNKKEAKKTPVPVKPTAPMKQPSSSEEDSSDEDEKPTPKTSAKKPAAPAKKEESSSEEDSSDEEEETQKPAPKKSVPAKKAESSSEEDSSDDEEETKKPSPKKAVPAKEESSSEEDSSEDEEDSKKPTPKKAALAKESSSEEDSSEDEEETNKPAPKKAVPAKEESSSEDSSDEEPMNGSGKQIETQKQPEPQAQTFGKKRGRESEGGAEFGNAQKFVRSDEGASAESCEIFVAKLASSISNEDLEGYFSTFGEVSRARVATDRETGDSRGFAFVTFTNPEDAKKAAEKNEHHVEGFKFFVRIAEPKKEGGFGGNVSIFVLIVLLLDNLGSSVAV